MCPQEAGTTTRSNVSRWSQPPSLLGDSAVRFGGAPHFGIDELRKQRVVDVGIPASCLATRQGGGVRCRRGRTYVSSVVASVAAATASTSAGAVGAAASTCDRLSRPLTKEGTG